MKVHFHDWGKWNDHPYIFQCYRTCSDKSCGKTEWKTCKGSNGCGFGCLRNGDVPYG